MKRLIIFLIILGFAVWAGIKIAHDPGYMLMAYGHWTVETPLWFGIILWLLFALAIIALANIWRGVHSIAAHWQAWRSRRNINRSNNLTLRGLLDCIEGYFDSAEKNLVKAIPSAEMPIVDYLIAAYSANQQGEYEKRDEYLNKAHALVPEAEIAVKLLKIEWLLSAHQITQAQIELELLLQDDPYQNRGLMLAKDLYLQTGNWEKLIKITSTLRKRKMITQEAFEELQIKSYAALLIKTAENGEIKSLNAFWLTIPSHYQSVPELALVYAKALIQYRYGTQAEDILRNTLKNVWDDELIYWYGLAVTDNTEGQLKTAEKWLTQHENDAMLLLTLGRLCIRADLWAKARSYLESSIAIEQKPETYLVLAELARKHGDNDNSAEYYHQGLELALNKRK